MPDSYPINLNVIKIFSTCLVFVFLGLNFYLNTLYGYRSGEPVCMRNLNEAG